MLGTIHVADSPYIVEVVAGKADAYGLERMHA
jgi:hypothetical protein